MKHGRLKGGFMEIRVLRYFLTVVREESITKASEALHITQPTLSRQLAQLEEEIGVKLFDSCLLYTSLEKNIKLATYASRCIENEILMYLRRDVKRKSEVSLDEPLNVDWDGNELLLSDIRCV